MSTINVVRSVFNGISSVVSIAGAVMNLPTQTGNSGKFLTTDGTSTSWATPAGAGTVTSFSATPSAIFNVATATSTPALSLDDQAANIVLAGPSTGSAATPGFRALVDADIPSAIARDSEVTSAISALSTVYQPLDADLTALAALSGTDVIYYRSATNTWTAVTIGSNLTFSGGTLSATGGGGGSSNSFETISVSGQDSVVADSSTDTLTLAAGTSISITTNKTSDTITIDVTGLVIGTNVQAWDADLDTWAGITPGTGVATFLATPSSANLAAAVTGETGSGALMFGTAPTFTGATGQFTNTGLTILDTNASHTLGVVVGSDLTANRTFTITTGDASRTLTMTGNATLNQNVSTTGDPTFNTITTTSTASFGDTAIFNSPDVLETVTIQDGAVTTGGNVSVGGNLLVTGDLQVNGTTVTFNTATVEVEDSLMELAVGNTGNVIDIGFYGNYQTAATPLYLGFVWDASSSVFRLFTGSQTEPTSTIDTGATGYTVGTLVANLTGTASLASTVTVADAGSDTTCFVLLSGAATGSQAVLSDTDLPYNASTKILSATGGFSTAGSLAGATLSITGSDANFNTNANGYVTAFTSATSLLLSANDAGALGASGTAWSDLFLASGGVINFNNGNLTLTHSAGLLTNSGAYQGTTGTFTATTSLLLGTAGSAVGNIGFRNATSGTATLAPPTGALGTYTVTLPNAASTLPIFGQQITFAGPTAARTVTLPDEAFTVAGLATTQTLTNKRVTPRRTTETSSATPTINTNNTDVHSITALAAAITSFTTNLSGTPTHGQKLLIEITDNGTARAIAWGASFEASGVTALPTTTVISTMLSVGFIWNSTTSKWRCVAAS